jgi:hypothetical protein
MGVTASGSMSLTGSRESLARSASCKRYEVYSYRLLGLLGVDRFNPVGKVIVYNATLDLERGGQFTIIL